MERINITKPVTLTFTPDQLGVVLESLRQQPYNFVFSTIHAIEAQITDHAKGGKKGSDDNGEAMVMPSERLKH
jgi:hypothetical protein